MEFLAIGEFVMVYLLSSPCALDTLQGHLGGNKKVQVYLEKKKFHDVKKRMKFNFMMNCGVEVLKNLTSSKAT